MPKRSKKVLKLRRYRDKLIADNVNLRSKIRIQEEMFHAIRKALQREDTLNAYAVASNDPNDEETWMSYGFIEKNEAIAELTLVYKMLSIEREFTHHMIRAATQKDYLRVAALSAEHLSEAEAHDKMLSIWSVDHGFTKSLRDECNEN